MKLQPYQSARLVLIPLVVVAMYVTTWAQDPNDPGLSDTIWVDCSTKAVHDTGGWATFTVYLKTDNQGAGNDVTALDLPLYLSRTNSNDSARIDTTVSLVFASSAFNDSGNYLAVGADSVDLNVAVSLGALNFNGSGLLNGVYTLAQLWIHLSDSTLITIDTTTRGSSSLRLVTSQAIGYVPIFKKVACNVYLCVGTSGDVNGTPPISLPDVIYLVNFVFDKDRPATGCLGSEAGNCWTPNPLCRGEINGASPLSLPDVIHLVNYVFDKDRPATGCRGTDPGSCWVPVASDLCCSPTQ